MKKTIALHPLFFAVYPVLALFAHNIALLPANQIIRPLAVIALSSLLVFFLLSVILKDGKKAGILTSLFVLWFFSYGHFYSLFYRGFIIGPRKAYFILSVIPVFLGAYFTVRTRRDLGNLTKILNVVSAFLVLLCLVNIGIFEVSTGAFRHIRIGPGAVKAKDTSITSCPNIYYIILDGYAREDVLKEIYGYDNSDFLHYLAAKGFYVAGKSSANYCQTFLSLASSMNLGYLDGLVSKIGSWNPNRKWAMDMMRDNLVFKFLKQYGYTTVSFDAAGGWEPAMITNTDRYYNDFDDPAFSRYRGLDLNFFEKELVNTTPVLLAMNRFGRYGSLGDAYDSHRKKLLYTFYKVEDISREKGPIFVLAHFLLPHQPFVFSENGDPVKPDVEEFSIWCWDPAFRKNFRKNYKMQIRFTEKMVRKMIDRIIADSPRPPVIILQADHGPEWMLDMESPYNTNLKERMSILNAYYLPGHGAKGLYPSITPVNTFRVVFDDYFGTDYGILADKSYFSTWTEPYRFFDVADRGSWKNYSR